MSMEIITTAFLALMIISSASVLFQVIITTIKNRKQ